LYIIINFLCLTSNVFIIICIGQIWLTNYLDISFTDWLGWQRWWK